MTTATDLKTDYDTHDAVTSASPPVTEPQPFMSMLELDGKWAIRVDGVTAFLPEKHTMANLPAQAIIQAVMGAVNNAVEHKAKGTTSLGSSVLTSDGQVRDLNVPKTDETTMDQGLRTADAKSVGSQLASTGAFGKSSPPVDNVSIRPSSNAAAEFGHDTEGKTGNTGSPGGAYAAPDAPKNTYSAVEVERLKDDGKSPVPDKKPTTLPPKDAKSHK